MLPELKPFYDAVQLAVKRRLRALESTFRPGINVWYTKGNGTIYGPVVVAGRPTHDAKIPVRDEAGRKLWIKCSHVVAKGARYE